MLILLMTNLRLRKANNLLQHHLAGKQQLDPICLTLQSMSFLLLSLPSMGKSGHAIRNIKKASQVERLTPRLGTWESQSRCQVKTRNTGGQDQHR